MVEKRREDLLERRSGDVDGPRILGAFNEPCTDWLNFFASQRSLTVMASINSGH